MTQEFEERLTYGTNVILYMWGLLFYKYVFRVQWGVPRDRVGGRLLETYERPLVERTRRGTMPTSSEGLLGDGVTVAVG